VHNVIARPAATILVQDPAANGEAWLSGTGPGEVLRDTEAQRLGRLIRARYLTETGQEQLGAVMARYDDVVMAVRPERWMAWDTKAFNARRGSDTPDGDVVVPLVHERILGRSGDPFPGGLRTAARSPTSSC
jgi:hypothetical protein